MRDSNGRVWKITPRAPRASALIRSLRTALRRERQAQLIVAAGPKGVPVPAQGFILHALNVPGQALGAPTRLRGVR